MSTGDTPGDNWLSRIKSALGLNEPATLREGIEDALQESDATDDFSPTERALLTNVLKLRDVRVSDLMTPRARIVGLSEDTSLAEVLAAFRDSEHARMPVYGETLDDPKGMIHIRDFLAHLAGSPDQAPFTDSGERLQARLCDLSLLRPLIFVPPSTPAIDLLVRMQSKRVHMALVIDEYGETDGLVTMEDLVEAIVGDINDEHDMPEPIKIARQADHSVAVDADTPLETVAEFLGLSLEGDRTGIEVGSIGGLVIALAGRVPQAGETIDGPHGMVFEITEAVPRQLRRLVIRLPAPDESAPDPTPSAGGA